MLSSGRILVINAFLLLVFPFPFTVGHVAAQLLVSMRERCVFVCHAQRCTISHRIPRGQPIPTESWNMVDSGDDDDDFLAMMEEFENDDLEELQHLSSNLLEAVGLEETEKRKGGDDAYISVWEAPAAPGLQNPCLPTDLAQAILDETELLSAEPPTNLAQASLADEPPPSGKEPPDTRVIGRRKSRSADFFEELLGEKVNESLIVDEQNNVSPNLMPALDQEQAARVQQRALQALKEQPGYAHAIVEVATILQKLAQPPETLPRSEAQALVAQLKELPMSRTLMKYVAKKRQQAKPKVAQM